MLKSSILIPSLTLLISIPILFLLAPKILPTRQISISVSEELEDLSLFQKAISAETFSPKYPSRNKLKLGSTTVRPPKIAFLFLTNSDLKFSSLWEKFFNTTNGTPHHSHLYNIYIHADPFIKITPLSGVFKDRLIQAKRTQRSSPTLISAERRLLAHALLDDPSNYYFALISQHCIPLHSFNYFYNFLLDTQKLSRKMEFPSYVEILDESDSLLKRYNARGKGVMLPEVKFDEFKVGSQFFVLTRKHSLMVIKDRKLWRKFKKTCIDVQSCYPEEHYFPTLLSMEDPNGCTKYTLTSVDWTDMVDGHPHTYHQSEVSRQLIYDLRKSNSSYDYMFARKFSADCLNPLMEIADSVIFKD
ncbi:glycosyltransferase BC10-like [Lycium ferocissimum]|uniref:glycosyltransferase BC10-like n=1 Tax=Lycium ferocissimum TaxID=112874 RepID=UPI0028157B82|nr:glycosyltransferase BC10-like [Lycium ferocissimum]